MKTIDLLISGLTDTQKRELLEEVTSIYSLSSPDFVFDFFSASCDELAHTLKNFHYYDRLSSLEELIKKQKNRRSCEPNTSQGKPSKIKPVTNFFPKTNLHRLFLNFLKESLGDIAKIANYNFTKVSIDKIGVPLSALGIFWFIARLLRHTTLMLKHLISSRSTDYAKKYWSEWLNDLVWLTTNTLTFGIATGLFLAPWAAALGPGGIILTAAMLGFDVLNAAAKAYTKVRKINRILVNINNNINSLCDSLDIQHSPNTEELIILIDAKEKQLENDLIDAKEKQLENEKNSLFSLQSNQHNISEQKNQLGSLKILIETRERMKAKKAYIKHEAAINVVMACTLLLGVSLLIIPNPISALVGSSIVLLAYGMYQYAKHKYLPAKEIQLLPNPLESLHLKLMEHIESQIDKLEKSLVNLIEGQEKYEKTKNKLFAYQRSKASLDDWKKMPDRSSNTLLCKGMSLAMYASKIRINRNVTPASYSALKSDIKSFLTPWRGEKESQDQFQTLIKDFVRCKIKPSNALNSSSCLLFNRYPENNEQQETSYAIHGAPSPG